MAIGIAVVAASLLHEREATAPAAASSRGSPRVATPDIIGELASKYLTVRPAVGPVTAVDVAGEPAARLLLATTLQGVVNRSRARLYLLDSADMGDGRPQQLWLDRYVGEGLVSIEKRGSLDDALDVFAREATGYVVASEAEPWTINAATTIAAAKRGVVVTAATLGDARRHGLRKIADLRGRWADAATAYRDVAARYRKRLAYPGLAVQQPDRHWPRDFFVQQGIMTVFGRPSRSDWGDVMGLVDSFPTGHAVYGYTADNGIEEFESVSDLTRSGKFLVPTDTTRNLSFHVAVGAARAALSVRRRTTRAVAPCTPDRVNVVVTVSDGDNIAVPSIVDQRPGNWLGSRRGDLALGWSITPGLAELAPAMWNYYAKTIPPHDELVAMMGLGYVLHGRDDDATAWYASSFALQRRLGIRAFWALDLPLQFPNSPLWARLDDAAAHQVPSGVLVGYLGLTTRTFFRSPRGLVALVAHGDPTRNSPAGIASQIRALLATPPAQRDPITFFEATIWAGTVDQFIDSLQPLMHLGVRFLTPSQAFTCVEGGLSGRWSRVRRCGHARFGGRWCHAGREGRSAVS